LAGRKVAVPRELPVEKCVQLVFHLIHFPI
jgi:hypothetical protein